MKARSVSVFVSLSLVMLLPAAADVDRQLAEITEARDKALARVSEPIHKQYILALQDLFKKATQANDLDGAVKVKAALDALDPNAKGSRFRGTWTAPGGSTTIEFTNTGVFREFWNNQIQEGKWKAVSDVEAKMTLKNGNEYVFQLNADGKSVTRTLDWIRWVKNQ